MAQKSSSEIARIAARSLDEMGYLYVKEIAAWMEPMRDGTYRIVEHETVREWLFEFMSTSVDMREFASGKLDSTLDLATLSQKNKSRWLEDRYIAFTDGYLDCETFAFEPFAPAWEKGAYKKGDIVRQGVAEYKANIDIPNDETRDPASYAVGWDKLKRKKVALIALPMTYADALDEKKNACPKWEQFIADVFVTIDKKPDPELVEVIGLMCGYMLMPHVYANKIFMLSGPEASNGKSTFLSIVKGVLPEGMYIEKKFKEFANGNGSNWGRADLVGKRLIICNEESSREVDSGLIKELSDGMSTIEARRLYQQPFQMRFRAKVVAAFNTPPEFDRVDQGLLRRFLYIPCHNKFDGSKHSREIIADILTERAGILAWMVRWAHRLCERKWQFPETDGMKQERKEMLEDQNTAYEFSSEFYTLTADGEKGTPFNEIYQHYVTWIEETRRKPKGKKRFSREATPNVLGKTYYIHGVSYRACRRKETPNILESKNF